MLHYWLLGLSLQLFLLQMLMSCGMVVWLSVLILSWVNLALRGLMELGIVIALAYWGIIAVKPRCRVLC